MSALYPPIDPYDRGMLGVGDGHTLYYEQCGRPTGAVALFLHGGPGGGCQAWNRRLFDPNHYPLVLFDQLLQRPEHRKRRTLKIPMATDNKGNSMAVEFNNDVNDTHGKTRRCGDRCKARTQREEHVGRPTRRR